jgi:hypothetical protein
VVATCSHSLAMRLTMRNALSASCANLEMRHTHLLLQGGMLPGIGIADIATINGPWSRVGLAPGPACVAHSVVPSGGPEAKHADYVHTSGNLRNKGRKVCDARHIACPAAVVSMSARMMIQARACALQLNGSLGRRYA